METLPSSSSNFAEIGAPLPFAAWRTPSSSVSLLFGNSCNSACVSFASSAAIMQTDHEPRTLAAAAMLNIPKRFIDSLLGLLLHLIDQHARGRGSLQRRGHEKLVHLGYEET